MTKGVDCSSTPFVTHKKRLFRLRETADIFYLTAAAARAAATAVIAAHDENSENKEPDEIVTVEKIA